MREKKKMNENYCTVALNEKEERRQGRDRIGQEQVEE